MFIYKIRIFVYVYKSCKLAPEEFIDMERVLKPLPFYPHNKQLLKCYAKTLSKCQSVIVNDF